MSVGIITYQNKHGRKKGEVGSSVIRGDWLVEKWDEAHHWKNGRQYDAIIFQKVYWKEFVQDYRGIKILDLCDPDWLKAGGEAVSEESMMNSLQIAEYADYVDAVTCSSKYLAAQVEQYIDIPVYNVPDRLNLDYFKTRKKHKEKAKCVVWFGYINNVREVLHSSRLYELSKRGLDLLVVSNDEFNPVSNYGVNIRNVKWMPQTAYQTIQEADYAINPRSYRTTFRFKSNNKTLISWGLGLPVAESTEDMDKFADPLQRQKEAHIRWDEITSKWDIRLSIDQYKKIICSAKDRRKK